MRRCFLGACASLGLLLLLWVGAPSARAAVIYDAQDANNVGELVPNADDGTPGRPPGSRMGNTVIFVGTERALDSVLLEYGTYHFNGQTSPTQTITLSLYLPDGDDDIAGQNGNQPGTLIGSSSLRTAQFNGPDNLFSTLTFKFGGLVVPDSVVAIVSSTLIGDADTQTGFIASSDFTPNLGSNPHGDRLWFGDGPGSFFSDNFWAQFDGGGDPSISNNMMMVFNAHDLPEPASAWLLIGAGAALLPRAGRTSRRARRGSP
jgi:hypothetical protein